MIVAYDGTNYYGFQHQDEYNSIEDELIKAINKIDRNVNKVVGSGRTDRFVHAKGQVIHFDTNFTIDAYKWLNGVNTFLPKDIRIIESTQVSTEFHARFSASSKHYSYFFKINNYELFDRNFVGYYPNLNVDLLETGFQYLVGTHDYRGFCSSDIHKEKDTVKTIKSIEMKKHGDVYEISFLGTGFLKHQIRKMMGTLIDLGYNRISVNHIKKIIELKDPQLSNKVAVGCGLYLMEVLYEE